jgi:hypothetical protein
MEGKNDEFDIFNEFHLDNVEELLDFFPFNNSFDKGNENFNFFFSPNSDNFSSFNDHHKNFTDGDQLLEKINKYEQNYNNLIQYNLMGSPTASNQIQLNFRC